MAQCFAIGAMQNIDAIKAVLNREFELLEVEGIKVSVKERPAGKLSFLFCYLNDFNSLSQAAKNAQLVFKRYIAEAVSELILNQWEQFLIHSIIKENYYYFDQGEKETIFQQALLSLENKGPIPGSSFYCRMSRKRKVLGKLQDFLSNNNQIIIEGFIRFRLKEYLKELEEIVDTTVDDFLLEKDYKEFVQLLKYFISIQNTHIELVHVVFYRDGFFKLFDEQKKEIESGILEEMFQELLHWEISYEDLLVTILVSLAPRQIVFHGTADESNTSFSRKTIRDIFPGSVKECGGCDLCLKQ